MNEFTITPFRGLHLLLLLLTAAAVLLIFLLLRGKPEARRSRFLIGVCFFNLALFVGYKLSLSMDAAYVRAYYPNGFNIFNELPLHLCNINLFLIPLGVWKRNRSIMGFSFFVAPLGALMALLFPEPLFSGFSLLMPRIFGYNVTHAILVVCGLSLATLALLNYPMIDEKLGQIAVDFWETTWQSEKRVLPYETRLLLSLTNAVGAGRMRQAARELVKAYIHGVESAALDDVFELLAWNQGIGFFSSEIGPSALFQAYKLIKNGEKQGKSREDICSALREKFGEKNPEMQVLH